LNATHDFIEDIPLDVAVAAHRGTSWTPDERGEQERQMYAAGLGADWDALFRLADTDEKRATLESEFTRYRAGYCSHYLVYLDARSRCMSSMIAGPSRFPTAKNAKWSSTADKRGNELAEYRLRALAAISKELQPELRPIMSGDADAPGRLLARIAEVELDQERMRAANAAIRKHARAGADAQIAALVGLGFSEENTRALLKPDFCGRVGFADYQLKNNGAELRRLRSRFAAVARAKLEEPTELAGERATIEDCPAENRVRLRFPDKPVPEVRTRLKRAGFRWAPSTGCWQAYRNPNSLEVARREAGAGAE
jgi:hypothetical protein